MLRQGFPRVGYEILVVKNFHDEESDRRIRENGLVGIFQTDAALGIHLSVALERAKGEVVAFLNDDDLWEPGKLELAARRFRERPSLGFHATSYAVIDEDDRPAPSLGAQFAGLDRFAREPAATFEARRESPPEDLDRFAAANPGSDSTVSIRTSVLRAYRAELAVLPSSVDTFLLTCAILSGFDLLIEYVPLTRLRIHRENMSRATDDSFGAYLEKYAQTMGGFAAARTQMVRMAEKAGNRWLLERWRTKERSLAHFAGMARGDLTRREVLRSLSEELRSGGRQRGLVVSELLYLGSRRFSAAVNFLVGRRIAGA